MKSVAVFLIVIYTSGIVNCCSKKKEAGTVHPTQIYPTPFPSGVQVEGNYGQWKLTGTEVVAGGGGGFGRSVEFNVMAMNLQTKHNFFCKFSCNPTGCSAISNNSNMKRTFYQQVLERVGSNVQMYRSCGPRIISDTRVCGNQAVFTLH
ncbi:uncharacterized protein LOC110855332 [Folsomia candida]|uniref:Uncharacterized protein n=1 Tax=Folsomia candida TaxID=158441 RepID=A0A226DTG5_FOLCA|nr:uncharacterized protein LOC110855332 [Folsomia candida]OXA48360.1 hypothetical protein Fcan01_17146 [Folsomia candida]